MIYLLTMISVAILLFNITLFFAFRNLNNRIRNLEAHYERSMGIVSGDKTRS